MIRKAGSANNRQLFVCALEWSFAAAALVFLPLSVAAREVEKHAARMPYIGGSGGSPCDRRTDGDQNPYRSQPGLFLSHSRARMQAVRRDAFGRRRVFVF